MNSGYFDLALLNISDQASLNAALAGDFKIIKSDITNNGQGNYTINQLVVLVKGYLIEIVDEQISNSSATLQTLILRINKNNLNTQDGLTGTSSWSYVLDNVSIFTANPNYILTQEDINETGLIYEVNLLFFNNQNLTLNVDNNQANHQPLDTFLWNNTPVTYAVSSQGTMQDTRVMNQQNPVGQVITTSATTNNSSFTITRANNVLTNDLFLDNVASVKRATWFGTSSGSRTTFNGNFGLSNAIGNSNVATTLMESFTQSSIWFSGYMSQNTWQTQANLQAVNLDTALIVSNAIVTTLATSTRGFGFAWSGTIATMLTVARLERIRISLLR